MQQQAMVSIGKAFVVISEMNGCKLLRPVDCATESAPPVSRTRMQPIRTPDAGVKLSDIVPIRSQYYTGDISTHMCSCEMIGVRKAATMEHGDWLFVDRDTSPKHSCWKRNRLRHKQWQ